MDEMRFYLNYDSNNGEIINTRTGKVLCKDCEIKMLNISQNILNKLESNNIFKLSKLLQLSNLYLSFYNFTYAETEELIKSINSFIAQNENVPETQNNFTKDEAEEKKDNSLNKYLEHLSVRGVNVLKDYNINTIEDLLVLDIDTIKSFKNSGKKTLNEILNLKKLIKKEKSEYRGKKDIDYLIDNGFEIENNTIKFIDNMEIENTKISDLGLGTKLCDLLIKNKFYNLSDIIKKYYDLENIESFGKKKVQLIRETVVHYLNKNMLDLTDPKVRIMKTESMIIKILSDTKFDGINIDDFMIKLGNNAFEEDVNELMKKLLSTNKIKILDGKLYFNYQSIMEYLAKLDNSKNKEIVLLRLQGLTLEQVGEKYNVTRERIRQIESKYLKKHKIKGENKLVFAEDRYEYLFKKYYFSKREFDEIFGEEEIVGNYLEIVYKRGDIEYSEAMYDDLVDVNYRKMVEKHAYKNHYTIDGEYVPKTFVALLKYYVKKYAINPIRTDKLEELVKEFVYKIDSAIDVPTGRAFEGYFTRMDVISSFNKEVRYYDYSRFDYKDLLEELNIDSYMNCIISTELYERHKPGLLVKYDLRDKYELHNLLRRIYGDNHPYIRLSRMPFIEVGNANIKEILLDILQEFGDLGTGEFLKILDQRFGIEEQASLWLKRIEEYQRFGGYRWIDTIPTLTNEEISKLKSLLPNEFYWKKDILNICRFNYPSFDIEKLSYNNLKKLGFTVNKNYVIKAPLSAIDYFKKELLKEEVFNISKFKEYIYLQIYEETFMDLKQNLEIIEFDVGMFVNIKRLEKLGITKDQIIKTYTDAYEFASANIEGDYFTINSLRKLNYSFIYDNLGFGNKFIESILKYGAKTSWVSMNNVCMFRKDKEAFSFSVFIKDIICSNEGINIKDLIDYILEKYGIKVGPFEIKEYIKNNEMFLDNITGKIYKNYKSYELNNY